MTQTGVSFKIVIGSKSFYVVDKKTTTLVKKTNVAETADKTEVVFEVCCGKVCKQTYHKKAVLKMVDSKQ